MGWTAVLSPHAAESLHGAARIRSIPCHAELPTLTSSPRSASTSPRTRSMSSVSRTKARSFCVISCRAAKSMRGSPIFHCLIGMEACVGAHHLGRQLSALGHDTRLMPARYVRPYSKGQKNDLRDAEAIAEALHSERCAERNELRRTNALARSECEGCIVCPSIPRRLSLDTNQKLSKGARRIAANIAKLPAKAGSGLDARCSFRRAPDYPDRPCSARASPRWFCRSYSCSRTSG
jgi:hypothetical protein